MPYLSTPLSHRKTDHHPRKEAHFVLGDTSSGKTTLLKAMQGDLEPAAKPSGGFKTFDLGHQLSEDAPQSTLTFFDVSGKAKARARWPAYFSDCHAVVFVVDCSSDLAEGKNVLRLLLSGYE